MLYYSLNHQSPKVSFKEATIKGLASDKGLYFPERIPVLSNDFLLRIDNYSKDEIAYRIIQPYIGNEIPEKELRKIITETIAFDFPLVNVDNKIFSLELFHGPTLAFKDVGARFMSRCLGYFMKDNNQQVTVLVATSGDTGGAVAHGFYEVEGVNVIILYPSGKVSNVQELQLTTLGRNISAIEVNGRFDDCQRLVKQAFADHELNKALFLTSANSINVARWLPQQFYYFFAYQQWADKNSPPVFCVPSGNFGNICAGLLAHQSGLPATHFIAACNANKVVPEYLNSGNYQPKKAVATLSNAMDVGDPSNFVRILELFHKEFGALSKILNSYSISDEETKQTINNVYRKNHYLLDPHGAVGYLSLQRYLQSHPEHKGIFLETAHPIKFYDAVEPIIHEKVPVPDSITTLLGKEKKSYKMEVDYNLLKEYLLSTKT
ncbi:MAG TPA: threonine synthase [Puia sp.]|nr:threonine synthase [Puia sp.]